MSGKLDYISRNRYRQEYSDVTLDLTLKMDKKILAHHYLENQHLSSTSNSLAERVYKNFISDCNNCRLYMGEQWESRKILEMELFPENYRAKYSLPRKNGSKVTESLVSN